ncbi:MAG TPA: hypothetical protein PLP48_06815 [Acholeplasmataceae bacterium]|nr:hypothetical protein [Acholeplasmataceae bacterium]
MLNDIKTKNIQLRYPHKSYVGVTSNNSKNKISYTFAADIKNSRYGDSSRWADLTALLEKSRTLLNAIFENNLEKEIVFSGGDSIQGVFNRPEHAYMYGRLLQKLFYPEKIKVGIGIGEVFSYYEDKNSNYSTGQAFINAQSALNRAKSNDIDVQISSYESNVDEINIMLEMISSIRGTQTDYQKELDLMTEILFPFVTFSMYNTSYKLIEIINFKNSLPTFNITSSTDSSDTRIDIFIKNLESDISNYIKPILINKYVNKNLMELIEQANVYGIQSDLALLTQSTKQNISKMFNKAKIEQLRKYDIVIIKRLGDVNNGITDIEPYTK